MQFQSATSEVDASPASSGGTVNTRDKSGRRTMQLVRRAIAIVFATFFAIWLVLYVTKGRFLKGSFERVATSVLHRDVRVAGDFQLYFDPIELHVVAVGMHVANPAWASKPELFSAGKVDAFVAPLSLIFGRYHLRSLDMADGAIDAEWNQARTQNTWTFGTSAQAKPFTLPTIDRASVTGSSVRYQDPRLQLRVDLRLGAIASQAARIGSAIQLSGSGRLRSTDFTLTGALLSPDATIARGKNRLTLQARAAGNVIDVAGTLPSLADIENVPLSVKAQGVDLDDLLGIIDVVIPETRAYVLKATLLKDGTDYRFTKLTGRFGDSDIAGQFTVHDPQPRVRLDADLVTRSLDIVDAAPFIGYSPDTVATKGALAAAAETGAAPQHLLPNTPIPVDRMQSFDATLRYRIGVLRSKHLPITHIDLNLSLDHGLLKLDPLSFAMAKGRVVATLGFDARQRPVIASYDVRLMPTPMGSLFADFGVAESGSTGSIHGRMRLRGTGNTLHDSLANADGRLAFIIPSGTLSQRNVQLSELDVGVFAQRLFQHKLKDPVAINCGVVAFTVRNGTASADPILIDTTKNVIAGNGNFDFGTEAIDLSIKADGKKFSLFSAQSPIRLGGRFASPSINPISPALIGRAGAAVALGVVGTPLASVLAFVDLGGAKAAACGPVLAGATAAAQRTTKGKVRRDVGSGSSAGHRKKLLGIF